MPHPRPLLPLAAIAALAAAAACAALPPSNDPSLLAAEEPTPRGARCMVAPVPAALPHPGELVDAEAFRADAARLWARAGRPAGHVLFTVRHDAEGTQVRRAVVQSTVPAPLADSLQALVFAHRRVTPRAPEEWGVRLRVELAEEMAMTVGRRQLCAPRAREGERIAASPYDIRERGLGPPVGYQVSRMPTDSAIAWVRVHVDARGRVVDAAVERGVRRGLSEQRVLNQARSLAFYPALDDGYPIPSVTTVRLRLSTIP
jgi:hypothetical protein